MSIFLIGLEFLEVRKAGEREGDQGDPRKESREKTSIISRTHCRTLMPSTTL